MAVVTVLNLHFDPARLDDALVAINTTLTATRARPGSLGVEVVQDVKDPAHIQFIERWATIEDDDAYRAWRASGDAPASVMAPFVLERGAMTVSTVLDGV
jgi:quinol monooxygenase YgiN